MEIVPVFVGCSARVRRDAINLTVQKFCRLVQVVDLRPNEVTGYGTQTYQGTHDEKILWFHEITFLSMTDRRIDWVGAYKQVNDEMKSTEDYVKENPFVYESEKEPSPPAPIVPVGPRTEDQDRLNVQNQNTRCAKIGAKGTFTYEEWIIMRLHFGDICGRCKRPLERPVIDHVIPVSRGGTNYIENIQTLCKECNSGKNAKSIDYRDPDLVLSFLEKLEEYRKSS